MDIDARATRVADGANSRLRHRMRRRPLPRRSHRDIPNPSLRCTDRRRLGRRMPGCLRTRCPNLRWRNRSPQRIRRCPSPTPSPRPAAPTAWQVAPQTQSAAEPDGQPKKHLSKAAIAGIWVGAAAVVGLVIEGIRLFG